MVRKIFNTNVMKLGAQGGTDSVVWIWHHLHAGDDETVTDQDAASSDLSRESISPTSEDPEVIWFNRAMTSDEPGNA